MADIYLYRQAGGDIYYFDDAIVELRGGLPYGVGFGLSPLVAFAAAVLGNMLPIPFVLLLLNGILKWMKTQDNFLGKTACG